MMKLRPTFRTVWKINALIILVGGAGVCVILGFLAFEAVRSRFQPREKADTVSVEGSVDARWHLGPFETISGADYMVAPVLSAQSYAVAFKEREASATRNYLFVNLQDKSSRWLLPNNDRLILDMIWLAGDGSAVRWGSNEKPVKWLMFHVVTTDIDGDKRLTAGDRMLIAIANADGSQYAEVLRDVDTILGKAWKAPDEMLVVYSAGGKNLVSAINLPDRKVSVTKELPKLGQ